MDLHDRDAVAGRARGRYPDAIAKVLASFPIGCRLPAKVVCAPSTSTRRWPRACATRCESGRDLSGQGGRRRDRVQVGVGTPGGAEASVHIVRLWPSRNKLLAVWAGNRIITPGMICTISASLLENSAGDAGAGRAGIRKAGSCVPAGCQRAGASWAGGRPANGGGIALQRPKPRCRGLSLLLCRSGRPCRLLVLLSQRHSARVRSSSAVEALCVGGSVVACRFAAFTLERTGSPRRRTRSPVCSQAPMRKTLARRRASAH